MSLSVKNLTVLASMRKELISQLDSSDVIITRDKPVEIKRIAHRRVHPKSMRRAPRPNAFQRMCQRHDRW